MQNSPGYLQDFLVIDAFHQLGTLFTQYPLHHEILFDHDHRKMIVFRHKQNLSICL